MHQIAHDSPDVRARLEAGEKFDPAAERTGVGGDEGAATKLNMYGGMLHLLLFLLLIDMVFKPGF